MKRSERHYTRPVGNIEDDVIKDTTRFLNNLLANEFSLFTKTLNYHWNVTGRNFNSLHKFLEGHYNELLPVMDSIAERVRVLDEIPISTVTEMNSKSEIKEFSGKQMSSSEMVDDLFQTHVYIQEMIQDFLSDKNELKTDIVTEDFLVGILSKHETMSWMLKSHLV